MLSMFRRHSVEAFDIHGVSLHRETFWTRRAAEDNAATLASPFYDVYLDGDLKYPHTPPDVFARSMR